MFAGFKTVIFNLLALILPVLEAAGVSGSFNDEWSALYGATVAGINLYLRAKTTTPIFKDR